MPQFGGAAEKCTVCSKTVYLAEKIVVEDKEDKKTFHKTCLKCSHCKVVLTLGNYASMQGIFYCKPHFKQLFATKGNYDEGFGKDKHTKNWTPQAASAPASFVPVDKDEGGAGGKKETPSTIASKFGRTTLNTEKCHVCNKTVYATEKSVIEEKEGKKVFHKTCLKCSHCNVIVTLGNYASMQGVVYCKPHFKQLFAAKGNYDEGFGKEKVSSKWEPQTNAAPSTFVPVDKDSDSPKEKKNVPDNVASRFKGSASNTEKCQACGKSVYLTERIVVEDKEDKQTFHKSCLRCSHCQVVLTLGNYASLQNVMYCKPHFKQLFAAKGNYDEGFGKEKHTKKWAENGDQEPSKDESHRAAEEDHKARDLAHEQEIEHERQAQQKREQEQQREEERERAAQEEKEQERLTQQRKEKKERAEKEEREQEEKEERARQEKEERAREERAREEEEREREEAEHQERKRLEREEEAREEREREEQAHAHAHEHEHEHEHEHKHEEVEVSI